MSFQNPIIIFVLLLFPPYVILAHPTKFPKITFVQIQKFERLLGIFGF